VQWVYIFGGVLIVCEEDFLVHVLFILIIASLSAQVVCLEESH
jgi:hypothetical protein